MNHSNGPFWQANGLSPDLSASLALSQLPSLQSPYNGKTANLDTESVLSGYSERSKKGRNGGTAYASLLSSNSVNSQAMMMANQAPNGIPMAPSPYHTPMSANHSGQLIGNNLSGAGSTLGRHSTVKNDRLYGAVVQQMESPYDISNRQEVIEVQTLDDRWADNTTAITGNTSDHSGSFDDLSRLDKENLLGSSLQMQCQMWSGAIIGIVLSACAFLSPILMVILPKLDMFEWRTKECGPECDGLLISFLFKLLILLIGSWAVFFRRPKATLPRVCVYRAAVLSLVIVFLVTYWLFYSVRIAEKRFNEEDAVSYYSIVLFAISLVDALLFIHYLAVILLEIRHLGSQYFVKVVRSPDGFSQCYNLGNISIQRASVWILERYYQEFPMYNPHLERVPSRRGRKSSVSSRQGTASLKFYDVDGLNGPPAGNGSKATNSALSALQLSPKSILAQNTAANAGSKAIPNRPYMNGGSTVSEARPTRRSDRDAASHVSGHSHRRHNERFYEEHDYERRVRKRKSRLVSITEEAFNHIKRIQQNRSMLTHLPFYLVSNLRSFTLDGPSIPMDPKEAAQAIFPSIAKTLQKFLRITRQQSRHNVQSILAHLATCLSYDLSPKTFLEKYLSNSSVLANDEERKPMQTWDLICDTLLSRFIEPGTTFLLRQGDISLLVTVHGLPHFNIAEQVIDPKSNKFVFKLNSETSV